MLRPVFPAFARTVALLLVALAPAPVGAEDFCVGRGSFATHTTIAAALSAASFNGPGHDTVRLDTLTFAVPDTLTIDAQDLEIIGGFELCLPLAPVGVSVIDGSGGAVGSVIWIRNTVPGARVLAFDGVTIRGGGDDGTGGGIDIVGAGVTVTLRDGVRVTGNRSSNGGGVRVKTGTLVLDGAVIDLNESPNEGGGVICEDGTLDVRASTSIRTNTATHGGGIALQRCTARFTGGSTLSLFNNSATDTGGGLYAAGTSRVDVTRGGVGASGTISRAAAFQVRVNIAKRGAGIALLGGATLAASGFVVADNLIAGSAAWPNPLRGAGIHVGDGANLLVRPDPACPRDESCNLLSGNVITRNGALTTIGGAALAADDGGMIDIEGIEIADNAITGGGDGGAIAVDGLASAFFLERALLHHNGAGDGIAVPRLIDLTDVPSTRMHYLTIVDNVMLGTGRSVLRMTGAGTLAWRSSTIDQPSVAAASGVDGSIPASVDCLLASSLDGLAAAMRSVVGTAQYRDRAAENYRPALDAPQVDFCDGPPPLAPLTALRDLDGRGAPSDTGTANRHGAHDLGAYETQEIVFADSFDG